MIISYKKQHLMSSDTYCKALQIDEQRNCRLSAQNLQKQ